MQFAVEIQATLWNAPEFRVETTQSVIQKSTPQQQHVVRLTQVQPKNPELGIYQTEKQTNHETCLEIFTIMVFFQFSHAKKIKAYKICLNCTNKQVNRSV